MLTPIVEYKLCKKGKEIYREICNLLKGSIKKVELLEDEFELLLKSIPFHKRQEYNDSIPYGTKMIRRKIECSRVDTI